MSKKLNSIKHKIFVYTQLIDQFYFKQFNLVKVKRFQVLQNISNIRRFFLHTVKCSISSLLDEFIIRLLFAHGLSVKQSYLIHRMDQVSMVIKGYSAFPNRPTLLEHHQQMI